MEIIYRNKFIDNFFNEAKNNFKEINSESNIEYGKLINLKEMTQQIRYGVPQGYKRVDIFLELRLI
nr:hypothetical protein [uncultured Leptotrichia sp.]